MKAALIIFFLIGLVYLVWPGPRSVKDFSPLPESLKSNEPGDTIQVENVSAYFSNHRRQFATAFYRNGLKDLTFKILPPIRLNYPPEMSYTFIRDQQLTTFLEEFVYPMRESIFVNGYEPFDEKGKAFHRGITNIVVDYVFYDSKTTVKYYPSSVVLRLIAYFGAWAGILALLQLSKKALKEV